MSNKIEFIKKYASGNYSPGDKKEGLTPNETFEILNKESLTEDYLKSI